MRMMPSFSPFSLSLEQLEKEIEQLRRRRMEKEVYGHKKRKTSDWHPHFWISFFPISLFLPKVCAMHRGKVLPVGLSGGVIYHASMGVILAHLTW